MEVEPREVQTFVDRLAGKDDESSEQPPAEEREPSEITVDVLNGSSINALAGTVSDQLSGQGFGQGEVGNTDPRSTSVVHVPQGEEAAGERVAEALGGLDVEGAPDVPPGHVQVLLGPDYEPPQETAGSAEPAMYQDPAPQQGPQQAAGAPSAQQPPPDDPPIRADGVACVN